MAPPTIIPHPLRRLTHQPRPLLNSTNRTITSEWQSLAGDHGNCLNRFVNHRPTARSVHPLSSKIREPHRARNA
jgi:hypothetical protein